MAALKPARTATPLAEPFSEPMQGDEIAHLLAAYAKKRNSASIWRSKTVFETELPNPRGSVGFTGAK